MTPLVIDQSHPRYPGLLRKRLGRDAPTHLAVLGNFDLLTLPKTALFCSTRTPGNAILAAYDQAAHWREEGRCVISGFHSPIEKDCLGILLRGRQPIIACPARAIDRMRIPTECREPLADGRLLYLSPFVSTPRRATKDSATFRNLVVGALADIAFVAYIDPGGQTGRMVERLNQWGVHLQIMGG
jgi:predicted Rossmann fold nucleotide-binding protein DprA/Smf involved in DNA uptake